LSEKATKIKNESLASQAAAAAAVEAQAAAAASEASAAAETHAATTATEANTYWQKYIGHCLLLDFFKKINDFDKTLVRFTRAKLMHEQQVGHKEFFDLAGL
jgi:hypothetical protein